MTTRAFSDVLSSLRGLGLTRPQVTALLPEWWSPEMAKTSAGLWETVVLLGRRLGIDAASLLDGAVRPTLDIEATRYKHTVRVQPQDLQPATLLALSLARAIAGALPRRAVHLGDSAQQIRAAILDRQGQTLNFDTLVEYCWQHGIPVIPLPNLPRGLRKMDAAALNVDDRPAIVLAIRNDSKAWLSFLLAHELGHLCLGHVARDTALVEGSLTDSAEFDVGSERDSQEADANAFAHALLGGEAIDSAIAQWGERLPAVNLAAQATMAARPLRTAPGHLILRHAFRTHDWPTARIALRFLQDDLDAQSSLVETMRREIDTNLIAEDMQDFVESLTGIAPPTRERASSARRQ
jgi:hypothetical protein